jgi:hypothetical protein
VGGAGVGRGCVGVVLVLGGAGAGAGRGWCVVLLLVLGEAGVSFFTKFGCHFFLIYKSRGLKIRRKERRNPSSSIIFFTS